LLGFLPLGSGAIFALFSNEKVALELIPLIGLFGFSIAKLLTTSVDILPHLN
jgi:hypothetical protein